MLVIYQHRQCLAINQFNIFPSITFMILVFILSKTTYTKGMTNYSKKLFCTTENGIIFKENIKAMRIQN